MNNTMNTILLEEYLNFSGDETGSGNLKQQPPALTERGLQKLARQRTYRLMMGLICIACLLWTLIAGYLVAQIIMFHSALGIAAGTIISCGLLGGGLLAAALISDDEKFGTKRGNERGKLLCRY